VLRGVATVFATAVVGLVVRLGHLLIAVGVTALVLLILESGSSPGCGISTPAATSVICRLTGTPPVRQTAQP